MKLFNNVALTAAIVGAGSIACATTDSLTHGLADWVSIVAEILSFVCLACFICYAAKYIKTSNSTSTEDSTSTKVSTGLRDGIMTTLVGIGICQACIIIAQVFFAA